MSTSRFATIADVKAANIAAGGHWFDPDTMRFFGTRFCGYLQGGRAFVTSEQVWGDQLRTYGVRYATADGTVHSFGDRFTDRRAALRLAAQLGALTAAEWETLQVLVADGMDDEDALDAARALVGAR